MNQRGEAGLVQAREKQADGDPDGLPHVVVLDLRPVGPDAVCLLEDDDQVRSVLDVRLPPVRAQRPESFQPRVRHPALVASPFLLFRGLSKCGLELRIGDDDEGPGLLVRARRGRAGGRDGVLDELVEDGLTREVTNRASPSQLLEEPARAGELLGLGVPREFERGRTGAPLSPGKLTLRVPLPLPLRPIRLVV